MKSARIRALRKSIFSLLDEAMSESTGMAMEYMFEARELIDVLCSEFDDEEPEELIFD